VTAQRQEFEYDYEQDYDYDHDQDFSAAPRDVSWSFQLETPAAPLN
jgi:hypothetical protein